MTVPARRLRWATALVALVAVLASGAGIGVRSTFGGRAAVDEPEYLLTALSLAEDRDLSIADELAAERWRDFHDAELPVQTAVLDGGRRVSPHDPLLPLLLAGSMRLGGLVAAKLTIAALAGLLAALTLWVAVRRLAVPLGTATCVVAVASATAPLGVYGQQVYPELPAALATVTGVAALTGPLGRRGLVALGLAVVALPWLSVKYVPVAAALTGVALWSLHRRGDRSAALALAGTLAAAGAGYLALHQLLYGGWTVYATGDHFVESGEFGVVGFSPNYVGRSSRLIGLLVHRGYGLAAWQPAWLLVVPALGAVAGLVWRSRRTDRRTEPVWAGAVVLPLVAGWLNATFVALTMDGFWWPGRQVVVVLPLAVLVIAWWLPRSSPLVRRLAAVAATAGALSYGWLLVDGYARRLTWVSRFEEVGSPAYHALRPLLPDYRNLGAGAWARHGAWLLVIALCAAAGWRSALPLLPQHDSTHDEGKPDEGTNVDQAGRRRALADGRARLQ